jgi:hypothetical protein
LGAPLVWKLPIQRRSKIVQNFLEVEKADIDGRLLDINIQEDDEPIIEPIKTIIQTKPVKRSNFIITFEEW